MGSDLSNDSYYKVVQLLSDAGVNCNVTDSYGRKPLHLLAINEMKRFPWIRDKWHPLHGVHFTKAIYSLGKRSHLNQVDDVGGNNALRRLENTVDRETAIK